MPSNGLNLTMIVTTIKASRNNTNSTNSDNKFPKYHKGSDVLECHHQIMEHSLHANREVACADGLRFLQFIFV
jgi:hypothetical protein